jgi:hypothetical protein
MKTTVQFHFLLENILSELEKGAKNRVTTRKNLLDAIRSSFKLSLA